MSTTLFTVMPNGLGLALLGVAVAMFSFALILCFLALYHAEFPPLRAKNLPLVLLSTLGSMFFYAGLVHALGVFSPSAGLVALQYCSVWQLWMLFIVGYGMYSLALTTRLYSLAQVMRWHRHPTLFQRIAPGLVLWFPYLVLAGVVFMLPSNSLYYDAGKASCVSTIWWKSTVSVVAALSVLTQLTLLALIFRTSRSVQEYKECVVGFLVSLVCVASIVTVEFVDAQQLLGMQIAFIVTPLTFLQAHFYYVIGAVLYGTVFDRDRTLKEFILDLQTEGAEYQQKVQAQSNDHLAVDSSYRQMLRKQSGVGAMGLGMSIGTPELNY